MNQSILTALTAHLDLPPGTDTWGIRTVHPDFRSSRGFRWPFPGNWAEAVNPEPANTDPCPLRIGDGICVANTWEGMASGGVSAITLLLVAYAHTDALSSTSADKVRVRRAFVVDVLDGAQVIRAHGAHADLSGADLRYAHLCGAELSGADLREAKLYGADLRYANLYGANLREANLSGADLREADLREADLREANLREANLSGADLREANLSGADLRYANLRYADLREANLSGADLSGAIKEGATGLKI